MQGSEARNQSDQKTQVSNRQTAIAVLRPGGTADSSQSGASERNPRNASLEGRWNSGIPSRGNSVNHFFTIVVGLTFTASILATDPPKDDGKVVPFEPGALGMKVPVLTANDDYDKHLGKLVAIRGKLSKSKKPTIAGVDVRSVESSIRDGDECYAVGILAKWVVKKEDVDNSFANRGAGTFYMLYADLVGTLAEPQPIPKK